VSDYKTSLKYQKYTSDHTYKYKRLKFLNCGFEAHMDAVGVNMGTICTSHRGGSYKNPF